MVSIYTREAMTEQGIAAAVVKVRAAFPNLGKPFADSLVQAFKRNEFNDQRAMDAIHHVIDTCEYPEPTVARFISFDRVTRLYSHSEVVNEVQNQKATWVDFQATKVNEKTFWVKKTDQP